MLSLEEEATVVAIRKHTQLPLDDCLYALQATIPHLTRSSLLRCLQRHGISRLPDTKGDKPERKKFKTYPIVAGRDAPGAEERLGPDRTATSAIVSAAFDDVDRREDRAGDLVVPAPQPIGKGEHFAPRIASRARK